VTHVPVFLITSPRALRSLRFARFLSTGAIIKFSGSKKKLFKELKRRTGLFFASFASRNRQKREESRIALRNFWAFFSRVFFRREKLTRPPSECNQVPHAGRSA